MMKLDQGQPREALRIDDRWLEIDPHRRALYLLFFLRNQVIYFVLRTQGNELINRCIRKAPTSSLRPVVRARSYVSLR